MSWLTKAIPALSKKNLAKTVGSFLPAPISGLANVLNQKKTGATPQYPTVIQQGGAVGADNIIRDLLGQLGSGVAKRLGWGTEDDVMRGGSNVPAPVVNGGGIPGVNIPVVVAPQAVVAWKAPKGYVLVQHPTNPAIKLAVLAKVAYALGLKKRPQKSTAISSRDIAGARKVQGFIRRYSVNRAAKHPIKAKGRRR